MKKKPKKKEEILPPKRSEYLLTRRESLAMYALAALIGKPNVRGGHLDYAREAVSYADAIISIVDGITPLAEPLKTSNPPPSVL